jgi:uncharacterized protein (DUF927 family)
MSAAPDEMFAPLGAEAAAPAPEAAREADAWVPILPAPLPLPPVIRHRKHGTPSHVWEYRDARGALLHLVARFDSPGGRKEILPLCCGADSWRWRGPKAPRPLYGLDALAARAGAPVLILEGEKATTAAAALFLDHVPMTWSGGAAATAQADWTPLRGRRVAIWPDADDPGRRAAAEAAKRARAAGAASVAIVDVPSDWPPGWDVADALPEGATLDVLRAMLDAAEAEAAEPLDAERDADDALPPGFRLTADGLFYADPGDDDAPAVHVCGPLRVTAATSDGTGHAWGALLEWRDPDGRAHTWPMPRAMLAGDGAELRAALLDRGLFVGPSRKARERLTEYLLRSAPSARVRIAERLGWLDMPGGGRVFVLPTEALGAGDAARVMLQSARPDALPPIAQRGTLEDWQRDVAALAVDNPRLGFALSAALAAPLLGLIGAEGGGIHYRGPSSCGKSTLLQAAGSVFGGGGLRGWVRSWRATDNALEAVAAAHCDLPLLLDEMGEAGADTVAAAAYMLANGCGKGRASRDGGARRAATWRLLFVSSGEIGISAALAEARGGPRRERAGQAVRVLDLPADGGRHGCFDVLHGRAAAAALADDIKASASRFYGTAGRAWLELLAGDPEGMAGAARAVVARWTSDNVPTGAAGQVRRAAGRFALIAAAGALATAAGLLPWRADEAERAAGALFAAWRGARPGGDGDGERAAAIAAVRRFLTAHGDARFEAIGADADDKAPRIINRAGWKRRDGDGWLFLVAPDVFKAEVAAGLDADAVARALRAAGLLATDDDARLMRRVRLPGVAGLARVYAIKGEILAAGDGGEEAPF